MNLIARAKVSIVDPTPGVTRDRVAAIVDLEGPNGIRSPKKTVEFMDTGGFGVYVAEGERFDEVGSDLATLTDDKAERKKASSTEAAMRDTLALANTREAFQSIFANMRRADSESQKQMVKLQQDQVQETKRTNELLRGIERAGSLTIIGAPL